jgi:hypothetical protein
MKTYEIRTGNRKTSFAAAKNLPVLVTVESANLNRALENELTKAAKATGTTADTIFVTTAGSNYVRTIWL